MDADAAASGCTWRYLAEPCRWPTIQPSECTSSVASFKLAPSLHLPPSPSVQLYID